jgi:hypothetical protein
MRLKKHIPEQIIKEDDCPIGRDEPEEKISKTAEGLEELKWQKELRKELGSHGCWRRLVESM